MQVCVNLCKSSAVDVGNAHKKKENYKISFENPCNELKGREFQIPCLRQSLCE